MLRPHHPKHAQLSAVGGAAEAAANLVVIGLAEVLLFEGFGNGVIGSGDHWRSASGYLSCRSAGERNIEIIINAIIFMISNITATFIKFIQEHLILLYYLDDESRVRKYF